MQEEVEEKTVTQDEPTSVSINFIEFVKRIDLFSKLTNIGVRRPMTIWLHFDKRKPTNLEEETTIEREKFIYMMSGIPEKELAWSIIVDPNKVLNTIVPISGITSIQINYIDFKKIMIDFLDAKYGDSKVDTMFRDLYEQIINNVWKNYEKIPIPSSVYKSALTMKFLKEKYTISHDDFIIQFELERHIDPEQGFQHTISVKEEAWDQLVKGSIELEGESIETSQEDLEKMTKELKESSYGYSSETTPRGSNEEARAEAARKFAEEKRGGKPLKGVSILVTMHGGLIFHNIPEDIKNKYIMVTNSGKCGLVTFPNTGGEFTDFPSIVGTARVFKSVRGTKKLLGEILEGDLIIANANQKEKDTGMGTFPDGTRVSRNTSTESYRNWYGRTNLRAEKGNSIQSPEYTNYDLDRLLEETKSTNAPAGIHGNSFIRTHTDMLKVWSPDKGIDFTSLAKFGLYIVATHHCEEDPLLESLETWSSNEYDAGEAPLTPHEIEGLYVLNRNLSFHNVFQKLQSLFEENQRIIPGISSNPANMFPFTAGGIDFSVTRYSGINLLTLVRCFLAMGFEFVNIIDTSCQVVRLPGEQTTTISGTPEDRIPEGKRFGLVRQASLNSTQQGSDIMQHLMDTRTGGRRKKPATRKKRNRKTRKGRSRRTIKNRK